MSVWLAFVAVAPLFIAKSGLMGCCNCRHTIGEIMPMYVVNQVAEQMLLRLANGL
jgi:hypothetical protein